jgi:hypothetical protein
MVDVIPKQPMVRRNVDVSKYFRRKAPIKLPKIWEDM